MSELKPEGFQPNFQPQKKDPGFEKPKKGPLEAYGDGELKRLGFGKRASQRFEKAFGDGWEDTIRSFVNSLKMEEKRDPTSPEVQRLRKIVAQINEMEKEANAEEEAEWEKKEDEARLKAIENARAEASRVPPPPERDPRDFARKISLTAEERAELQQWRAEADAKKEAKKKAETAQPGMPPAKKSWTVEWFGEKLGPWINKLFGK